MDLTAFFPPSHDSTVGPRPAQNPASKGAFELYRVMWLRRSPLVLSGTGVAPGARLRNNVVRGARPELCLHREND